GVAIVCIWSNISLLLLISRDKPPHYAGRSLRICIFQCLHVNITLKKAAPML
ncbi:3528_t:CDS:1, partial [Dentiscutata heterogama]